MATISRPGNADPAENVPFRDPVNQVSFRVPSPGSAGTGWLADVMRSKINTLPCTTMDSATTMAVAEIAK